MRFFFILLFLDCSASFWLKWGFPVAFKLWDDIGVKASFLGIIRTSYSSLFSFHYEDRIEGVWPWCRIFQLHLHFLFKIGCHNYYRQRPHLWVYKLVWVFDLEGFERRTKTCVIWAPQSFTHIFMRTTMHCGSVVGLVLDLDIYRFFTHSSSPQ